MPFRSERQRRYLYSQHPDIAERFQRETPKGAKLPERADSSPKRKAERMKHHMRRRHHHKRS